MDFEKSQSKDSVVGAWIGALFLAPFFFVMGYFLGGYVLGTAVVLLTTIWPILTYYSYEANRKLFRYYTWVYRKSEPVKGFVEITSVSADGSVRYTAEVRTPERRFQCEVIPTARTNEIGSLNQEMMISFDPATDFPLCAEEGGQNENRLRIWMEPGLFEKSKRLTG